MSKKPSGAMLFILALAVYTLIVSFLFLLIYNGVQKNPESKPRPVGLPVHRYDRYTQLGPCFVWKLRKTEEVEGDQYIIRCPHNSTWLWGPAAGEDGKQECVQSGKNVCIGGVKEGEK